MNQAVLLFPGERLSYHVVDYALDWASENEGTLKVLFFLASEAPDEGYPFPNDLDQAESLKKSFDTEQGMKQILQTETRYIEKRASARHVPATCVILYSPTLEELQAETKDAEVIFIDKDIDDEKISFGPLEFTFDDLKETNGRVFPVGEHDRYSDVFY